VTGENAQSRKKENFTALRNEKTGSPGRVIFFLSEVGRGCRDALLSERQNARVRGKGSFRYLWWREKGGLGEDVWLFPCLKSLSRLHVPGEHWWVSSVLVEEGMGVKKKNEKRRKRGESHRGGRPQGHTAS